MLNEKKYQNVTAFRNINSETGVPAADYNVGHTSCHYKSIIEKIKEAGHQAYYASPFVAPYPETLSDVCDRIEMLCNQKGKKYIYGYWPEPDSIMHRTGCYSSDTQHTLQQIEDQLQTF